MGRRAQILNFEWFMKGLGRGRVRSTEVAEVFGALFERPDGFGSSDFAQNVDFVLLYRSIWVSGADSIKHIDCLAEEGSNVEDLGEEKSAEISICYA